MLSRDVERKLTIFISSKIDKRYNPIRHALKTLLMETGLVACVYLFEQEASSQDTQGAYLAEVAQSDLCIFLIDNLDGVTDAVYREHKHASNSGAHRLYFFCYENCNEKVPLQYELEQSGETIYRPISVFAEIPKIAYDRAIQDILDWYRKRENNPVSNMDVQAHSIQAGSLLRLGKNVFSRYSSNNILVKSLNPYDKKFISPEKDSSTTFDHLCADFLRIVIGREPFSADVFSQLRDIILSESSEVAAIVDVLQIRLEAIAEFYVGNLRTCLAKINEAYEQVFSYEGVPEWLVNDIAIDMRNISAMLDQTNNRIQPNSEGQQILDRSAETVYYPLLDRFDANQKEKLLHEYYEIHTESPYTSRMGTVNRAFEDIASCFNTAVRFGSLTHILATRDRYEDVLFTIYIDCKEISIFRELARIYIITQDEKSLSKVCKAYRNSVDSITTDDISEIIESINTLPFIHKRFESTCLTLEYFGYYMSDEQYQMQEEVFFDQAHEWCTDVDSRIVATGAFILRTALSIIWRSDNTLILELVLAFLRNSIWRFIDETLKVIERVDYTQCSQELQRAVMEKLITLLLKETVADHSRLYTAIIAFRKNSTIDTSFLDTAVKEKDYAFYTGAFDLEIGISINPQIHLDKYISEARSRIYRKENGVYYTSYSYEPFNVIRNIFVMQKIIVEDEKIGELITLIQDTILNESNQDDAKIGAFLLSIYLKNTYPAHSAWAQFTELTIAHESEITNARFDELFSGISPNAVKFCYLLLKISLSCTSFEEVAIGFATMSNYPERDLISVHNYLSKYLSDADIDAVDNRILGIILNFVLSVGENRHTDALRYATISLIELLQSKSFAAAALMRLSLLMKNANSNTRVQILREVSKTELIKTDIGQYILQIGRTDNHFFVKKLASKITESIQEP